MDSASVEQKMTPPVGDISYTGFSLAAIKIQEGSVEELEKILCSKIDTAYGAYKNGSVVLNVEDVSDLNAFEFLKLQEACKRHDLFLVGVTGVTNEDRYETLVRRRIPVVNSNRYARIREENLKPKIVTQFLEVKVPVSVPVPKPVEVEKTVHVPSPLMVVCRAVRSGDCLNSENSTIVVYGSLGHGARVLTTQHVFIFGNVNGADIFAGAPKDEEDPGLTSAVIHVQGKFNPGMVSIAGNYRTAEDLYNDPALKSILDKRQGVVITLENDNFRFSTPEEFSLNGGVFN